MSHYLAFSDYAMWLLVWLVEIAVVARLSIIADEVPVWDYVMYCVLREPVLFAAALAHDPMVYWRVYWCSYVIGFAYQVRITFKLAAMTTNDKRWLWVGHGVTLAGVVLIALGAYKPTDWLFLLKGIVWCDCALAGVLMWLLHSDRTWRWPYRGIAWGLCAALVGRLMCAIVQQGNPPPVLRVAYQLASLLGLIIWWQSTRTRFTNRACAGST